MINVPPSLPPHTVTYDQHPTFHPATHVTHDQHPTFHPATHVTHDQHPTFHPATHITRDQRPPFPSIPITNYQLPITPPRIACRPPNRGDILPPRITRVPFFSQTEGPDHARGLPKRTLKVTPMLPGNTPLPSRAGVPGWWTDVLLLVAVVLVYATVVTANFGFLDDYPLLAAGPPTQRRIRSNEPHHGTARGRLDHGPLLRVHRLGLRPPLVPTLRHRRPRPGAHPYPPPGHARRVGPLECRLPRAVVRDAARRSDLHVFGPRSGFTRL